MAEMWKSMGEIGKDLKKHLSFMSGKCTAYLRDLRTKLNNKWEELKTNARKNDKTLNEIQINIKLDNSEQVMTMLYKE